MTAVGVWAVLCALCAPLVARAASPDSTALPPVDFDVIEREAYLRRHAVSLDHFFEFEPGGFVARRGPIGNDAFYSRWGIGRGRALLVVNGIPLNNPQNGTAPLVHMATSGLASLTLDAPIDASYAPGIEGAMVMRDLAVSGTRPLTFIELSNGTNDMRQRRVRFGSEKGAVGLDLSYDEVLNDGYDFDANDVMLGTAPEGRNRSRNAAIVVRGDLAEDTGYAIGLRRYRSSSTGDLVSLSNEATQSGHVAWASVAAGAADATIYGRGYTSADPDSETTNESVGGVIAWRARGSTVALDVFALGEHTNATQDVGGASAGNRTTNAVGGARVEAGPAGTRWFAHGNAGSDEHSNAWGAGAGVRQAIGRGNITLSGQRTFRLPSIGERYLPAHVTDGRVLSGSSALEAESAWEAGADWTLRAGVVTNRVRASWMESEHYIAFTAVSGDSLARRASNSDDAATMTFVEERIGVVTSFGTIEVRADAAGLFTSGDRRSAFQSVPRTQLNATLVFGRQFFEKSSALYLGGEYQFVDERRDYDAVLLPQYQVVNLSLVARLLDARFYLRWLNLIDEPYQTMSGYLMTPRTLAYGIEWTLFD